LKGQKLDPVPEKSPGGKAPMENTYWFVQVEQALQPRPIENGELFIDGQRRYTFGRAKRDLENPSKKRWEEWKGRCDLLWDKDEHGNPIEKPIRIYPEVVGVCPFKTCDADQIDLAKERLSEAGTGRFVWHDRPYVSWDVARRHLAHKRQLLIDRMSLLTHHQDLTQKFNFSKEKWYDEEKLLDLKERLIAKLVERSRSRPRKPQEKKTRRKAPITTHPGIFEETRENGEPYKRYTVRAASKKFQIPEPLLYKYMDEIPESTAIDLARYYFEHKRLPSELRQIPGDRCVPTMDERHLQDLHKARALLLAEAKRVAKMKKQKSARQICQLHRISDKWGRILVAKFLAGNLRGTRTVRLNDSVRGYTPTTTYSITELERRLNGRSLLEAAREYQAMRRATRGGTSNANGQAVPAGANGTCSGEASRMPGAARETSSEGETSREFPGHAVDLRSIAGKPVQEVLGQFLRGREQDSAGPFTKANNVKHWARVFGMSPDTMTRRLKDGKIRNKKLSNRLYQIAVRDLPAGAST
jgi:hypothetical protein